MEGSLNMHGPLESLPAYFKKTLINSIHSSLDIAVFIDKSIDLKFIFIEI